MWQYVTLMKRIYLVDCPGVVYPSASTPTEFVLKGVVGTPMVKWDSVKIKHFIDLSSWSKKSFFMFSLILTFSDFRIQKTISNEFKCGHWGRFSFYFQVRVELVKSPEDYISALLERVKPDYIKNTYKVNDWSNSEDFLEQIARKSGKLLKVLPAI